MAQMQTTVARGCGAAFRICCCPGVTSRRPVQHSSNMVASCHNYPSSQRIVVNSAAAATSQQQAPVDSAHAQHQPWPAAEEQSLPDAAARGFTAGLAALPLLLLPAAAVGMHAEPANALSLPTWAIHVSSVLEWTTAMALVWRFADVSGQPQWKGLTWGMMPLLAGALCACTHHFFYNDPKLDSLVALQAFFTVLGNATCWAAAYRIYAASKADAPRA